ncbi:MAG: dihydrofolate reductase [Planctomycetes bacterium]|nr:dihydrofolate reductase [Planctomycetota bacterium]
MKEFNIIVAMDEKRGIGKNGALPWKISADIKHFKDITSSTQDSNKRNAVIMGRKTWESIPEKFRPLPDRLNFFLTKKYMNFKHMKEKLTAGGRMVAAADFDEAFEIIQFCNNHLETQSIESVFIIGGGDIYQQAIKFDNCKKIYITHILADFQCDTFFPEYQNQGSVQSLRKGN